MQICTKCNTEAPDGIDICSKCGQPLKPLDSPKSKTNWLKWIIVTAIIGYVVWNQDDSNNSSNDKECCCEYNMMQGVEIKFSKIMTKSECREKNGRISNKDDCGARDNYTQ